MTIYALGTSHTYGECADLPGGQVVTPWPSILANKLGCEVINYGRPGINNLQLIEMAQYLCHNEKPSMIIAEMRWLPFPLLVDNHKNFDHKDHGRELFSDTRHNQKTNDKYKWQYHSINRMQAYQIDQDKNFKSLPWINEYPAETARDIQGYARINFFHNVLHNQQTFQAASNMYHMSALCQEYNIPVKVFVWAGLAWEIIENSNIDVSGVSTFDFFKKGMPFVKYTELTKSKKWADKHECSCGHWDSLVHEYFVDTILDEVNQSLTNV